MTLHFISGLPRSGSTLLAAILRQNPRFHAGMSSPLHAIVSQTQIAVSRRTEGALFLTEAQRRALIAAPFAAYYADNPRPVVFDTSRSWTEKLPLIADLFATAKVICCVREPAWIIDSIERLLRRNPFDLSGIFGYQPAGNPFARAEGLMGQGGMIGHALASLQGAYFGESAERLLVLEYQALCRTPATALGAIHAFLDEPWFNYDFENLHYEAEAFDAEMGTPGLHEVRGPVGWRPRRSILPPALIARYAETPFWRDRTANRGATCVTCAEPAAIDMRAAAE